MFPKSFTVVFCTLNHCYVRIFTIFRTYKIGYAIFIEIQAFQHYTTI